MTITVPFKTTTYEPRANLTLPAWLRRKLPPRDFLLGDILSTTSRWMLYGETGVGKTLFATQVGGAVSSGSPLLGWDGRRGARVMYIDGELPAETFKERMELIAEQYGSDLAFYGYNRDDLGDEGIPPLNTPEGQKWLLQEIDLIKPDLIIFDAIMCLLVGSMSDEESWAPIKILMRQISGRRIAQIWLHHTGHDTSKGFGTKTREWEIDTVISLTWEDKEAETVRLQFTKARLRKPETRGQFESRVIRFEDGCWTASDARAGGKGAGEKDALKRAIIAAYEHLAHSEVASAGFDGAPVRKVRADKLREEVKTRGYLETNEKGTISSTSRSDFLRAKRGLLGGGNFVESEGLIWRVRP